MFFLFNFLILTVSAFFFTAVFTFLAHYVLLRLPTMFDMPNERSNHAVIVPRGGGVAVMISILAFLFICDLNGYLLLMTFFLGVVSFMDDWKKLSVEIRLLAQVLAVGIGVTAIHGLVFQGLLPWYLDRLVVAVIWLWMLNLYNFMDGIDGITGTQSICICLGLCALAMTVDGLHHSVALSSGIICGAAAAFLLWNWHPAKMFLGDVGSIPLGFLIGYLLFDVAAAGYWMAALILPAYYVTDATLTLLRRLMAGKKIWEAHSEHSYQVAVRKRRNHAEIVETILKLNIVLIMLAVVSTVQPIFIGLVCLAVAYGLSLMLMRHFTHLPAATHHEIRATA